MTGSPTATRSANAELLSHSIHNALLAERFKNNEVRRITSFLSRDVIPDLRARLAARLENIATRGFDTGPRTTARLEFLFRDLRSFFDSFSKSLQEKTAPELARFATGRAAQLVTKMAAQVGSLELVTRPSVGAVTAALMKRPFDGVTLPERWKARGRKFRENVERQVRIGLAQGEVPQAIIRRVLAIAPGEVRSTAMTVRSAVAHAQAQARQVTYEENEDLLRGVMWVATLDDATCPQCGLLDGQVLPVDSGARPPLHPGPCRCTTVPILKSARELGLQRASMDGQVPEAVRWRDWIEAQAPDRQAESLGVGVARLFQEGRIDAADLVDGAGNRLSLAALERLADAS